MCYNIDWIIPKLRNPGRFWNCCSSITVAVVGLFSKIVLVWLNKTTTFNRVTLMKALVSRPKHIPLLTVSNHHSCFDDPGLWGILDLKILCSRQRMRWSLAACDICFTNSHHSYFFSLGKCVPVIRGNGVYQEALDFCTEKLAQGEWVHIFPEGKVNMTKEFLRFKWGVGRMVYECPITPIVIPIWHEGMDDILPNIEPYMLKFGKRVVFNIGEPIQLSGMIETLRKENVSAEVARKAITDRIQDELYRLRDQTHLLIAKTFNIKQTQNGSCNNEENGNNMINEKLKQV